MAAAPHRTVRLTTWSVVRGLLAVAAAALLIGLARAAETPLWWIAVAAVLAAMLTPAVLRLQRFVPRAAAIGIVLVLATAFGALVVWRGLSEVAVQVSALRAEAVQIAEEYEGSSQYGEVATEFALSDKVRTFFDGLPLYLGGGDTIDAVEAVTSNAGGLLAVFFLVVLLLVSGERMVRAGLAQVLRGPARDQAWDALRGAYRRTSRYTGLLILRAIVVGVVVNVVAQVAGWPAGTVIALWFALWSFVPGVGLVVAAGPVLVGVALFTPVWAAVALVGVVVGQYALARSVDHWIDAHVLRLGAALTLLAAAFGTELYGLGGALIMWYLAAFVVAAGHEVAADVRPVPDVLKDMVRRPATDDAVRRPATDDASAR